MVVLDMAGRSADRRLEVLSEPRERADGAVEFFSTAGRSLFPAWRVSCPGFRTPAAAREAEMEAGA